MISAGVKNTTGIAWRAPGGKLLSRVPSDFSVLLGQPELAAIFLDSLERYPNAKVHFGYRFVWCEQGDDTVTVHLQHGAEKIYRRCRFLVGADGGHSPVRKSLGIPLEGFTWRDFRFVAANIRCPLQARSGWDVANFVVHPTDWAVVIKTGKDDLWRVATGEKWDEEMEKQEELREKYRRILPGVVNDDVEFISAAAYTAHQRCAQRFLDGNVVLVGDAAHVSIHPRIVPEPAL